MRSLIFFIALAIYTNLEAQNNFANTEQQKFYKNTEKNSFVNSNEDSPLAHPAKKEFPYDFELEAKDPNYPATTFAKSETSPETNYATAIVNSEFFPLANAASKEFPYDFEIQSKTLQTAFETVTEKENFAPTWQPTFEEIQWMIREIDFPTDDARISFFRIKNKIPRRNFLSY